MDGYLRCFHVSAIVNHTAMNIRVCASFQIRVFIFSGYMPRSRITGSYGNFIKQIINKDLLYSPGTSTQYSVINYNGKENEKEKKSIYI